METSSLPLGVRNSDPVDNALRLVVLFVLQLSLFFIQAWAFNNGKIFLSFTVAAINGYYCGLGFFGVAHEAAHRLYFSHRFLNDLAGGISHAMVLVPFCGFREFHMKHHSHTHIQGKDPKDFWSDYPFWFASAIGAHLAPAWWYGTMFRNLVRAPRKFLLDVSCLGLALSYYCVTMPRVLGLPLSSCFVAFTLAQVPINILRAFTDHYGQPDARTSKIVGPGRIILLPQSHHRFLEWIGCHANYHALHHHWPTLPHTHYKATFTKYKHLNWAVHQDYAEVIWSLCLQRGAYGELE